MIRGVYSEIAGKADVPLFPNIETANCAGKTWTIYKGTAFIAHSTAFAARFAYRYSLYSKGKT